MAGDLMERSIAISAEQLRRIPEVIAVAGVPSKSAAIRAVLAGGFITVARHRQRRRPGAPRGRCEAHEVIARGVADRTTVPSATPGRAADRGCLPLIQAA